jgi:hypothetical protein
MPRQRRPLSDRFWEKVEKGEGCWLWTAATSGGYGVINLGYKEGIRRAHVVAYELTFGPVGNQWVLHRCDNPPCVRPDHLFLGDVVANNQDKFDKGRSWQQQRTACPAGHPYSDENTYTNSDGRRRCKPCRRARRRVQRTDEERIEMRRRMGVPRAQRTHCPQGHPYDEENTLVNSRGSRVCRACARERRQRAKESRGQQETVSGIPGRGDAAARRP